jgi:hypothetical protein
MNGTSEKHIPSPAKELEVERDDLEDEDDEEEEEEDEEEEEVCFYKKNNFKKYGESI